VGREAHIERETGETRVSVTANLDGSGQSTIETGIGFFDHMLTQIARHGLVDLKVQASGDLHVDPHHTVEDVGICLGKAVLEAVGEPVGLQRYGHSVVPMDEALAEAALDFSGRPVLVFQAALPGARVGEFDAELTEEFFQAVAVNSRTTLHLMLRHGKNTHHCVEALFKAYARALRQAVTTDPRVSGVPSSKGMLQT